MVDHRDRYGPCSPVNRRQSWVIRASALERDETPEKPTDRAHEVAIVAGAVLDFGVRVAYSRGLLSLEDFESSVDFVSCVDAGSSDDCTFRRSVITSNLRPTHCRDAGERAM